MQVTAAESTKTSWFRPWVDQNWLLVLALIPVIRILTLSSADGSFSTLQDTARLFWLPTLFFEISIFVLAVVKGLNLSKSYGNLPNPVKACLFLWLLSLSISTVQAEAAPHLALPGAGFWVIHLLFFAAVAHLFERSTSIPSEFVTILPLASATAGLVVMVFVYFTGLDSGFNWVEDLPGFGHIRHTGYIFAPAIALSLGHIAARPTQSKRVHMGLIAINTALMLWLGSRGPVFGLLLGLAICFPVFGELRSLAFVKRATTSIGLGALASVLLPIPQKTAFGALQRFWNGSADPTAFSSGRTEFWFEALALISERPFFGYGVQQFQFASETARGFSKHPHQSILQFIFDWGVIGGGLFLCLMMLCTYYAFFRSRCPADVKLVSALVTATLFSFSLIDGIYFYSYTIALSVVFILWPIVLREQRPTD